MLVERVHLKKPLMVSWMNPPHGFVDVRISVLPFFGKYRNKTFLIIDTKGLCCIYDDQIQTKLMQFQIKITLV